MSVFVVMVMVTVQWHTEAEIPHELDGIRMSITSLVQLRRQAILRTSLPQGPWWYGCVLTHAGSSLAVTRNASKGNLSLIHI